MSSKQVMFFAIDDDMYHILEECEQNFQLDYVLSGSFKESNIVRYTTFKEIPAFGYTNWDSWAGLDHRYMMVRKGVPVTTEEVSQRKGGVRFIIDPIRNPDVVVLCLGGIFTKKENVIIAGTVTGSYPYLEFSVDLFRSLSSKIKRSFKRIGAFYVGPMALEKLALGWRLVTNEKSPKEYDLEYTG